MYNWIFRRRKEERIKNISQVRMAEDFPNMKKIFEDKNICKISQPQVEYHEENHTNSVIL